MKDFIEGYIYKLTDALNNYRSGDIDESYLYDIIREIIGVFQQDMPQIEDTLMFRNYSVETDANILLGRLQRMVINYGSNDTELKNNYEEDEFFNDLYILNIEFNGIKSVLENYTKKGNINNYINQLEISIKNNDVKGIKYCLSKIVDWYNKNISKISSNQLVFDKDSHYENKKKLEEFNKKFSKYSDDINFTNEKNNESKINKKQSNPIIFLSHKSDDKKYADEIADFIMSIGIKKEQLIYTSHPLHKIPLDKNIYQYLRENIHNEIFMIILWSDKYLESPACMNELGAIWVLQGDYTNIYVPNFSFSGKYNECAVDTEKMGIVLNGDGMCKMHMVELKEKIENLFGIINDQKDSIYIIDKFINKIKELD